MVPLSDEQASQWVCLSKLREKISAFSVPRLISYRTVPSSVEKILIRVPLSLVVAKMLPWKFNARQDKDEL
jgi:hypothetical protein